MDGVMMLTGYMNRRTALRIGVASVVGFGTGALVGGRLFADRTQLAARIEETPAEHPLLPALQMASESLKALDSVKDYTATFHKQELVGRKVVSAKMELKVREEPFSVYLKFVNPSAGREVIYINGANNGNLLVHETGLAGLAGTMALDPKGKLAMDENRYPVTLIGMRTMAATVIEQWLNEARLSGVTVNFYPNAKIGPVSCKAVETSYRAPVEGVKYQLTRMYVDSTSGLPIRVQQYGFPTRANMQAPLIEDYMYTDLRTNIGLGDIDFDTRNPRYGF
jgi:hypothetical protein